MGRLPVLKPREVCRLLEDLGFVPVRQRGVRSSRVCPGGRGTTVPMHPGRDISPILLRLIARDIGMTAEELLSHR